MAAANPRRWSSSDIVHLKEAALGQQGHLPVHGHLAHLGHAGAQLRGRQRPPGRQGVHDAQPHRMQQQLDGVHDSTISHAIPLSKMKS
jgi:hypothetical protein